MKFSIQPRHSKFNHPRISSRGHKVPHITSAPKQGPAVFQPRFFKLRTRQNGFRRVQEIIRRKAIGTFPSLACSQVAFRDQSSRHLMRHWRDEHWCAVAMRFDMLDLLRDAYAFHSASPRTLRPGQALWRNVQLISNIAPRFIKHAAQPLNHLIKQSDKSVGS